MDVLFGARLYHHGINAHAGRHTARLALAAELPASVLADLTGISISTAERWSQWAKRDWASGPHAEGRGRGRRPGHWLRRLRPVRQSRAMTSGRGKPEGTRLCTVEGVVLVGAPADLTC